MNVVNAWVTLIYVATLLVHSTVPHKVLTQMVKTKYSFRKGELVA